MSNNYHLDTLEKCTKKLYRLRFEIKELKRELAAVKEENITLWERINE